jgi:3-oxoacyl-[acyl-carrier-protein] synthase II
MAENRIAVVLRSKSQMLNERRVVITGLGIIASNGVGTEAFWQANKKGISGTGPLTRFDPRGIDCTVASEVNDFDPIQFMPKDVARRVDRFVHFGLACTHMALADSKLDLNKENRHRVGSIIGSGLGGLLFHEEQMMAAYEKDTLRVNPICVPRITPNAVSSHIAIQYGVLGPNIVISTACASGAHAVGEAFRKIQHGEMDLCISGGVEAPLTPFTFGAYSQLRVVSRRNDAPQEASRPFDLNRDGFVLGEGGAVLILEALEHALKRNTRIYAEVTGYASNSGGHHIVMPDPDGADASRVMGDAIEDAGIGSGDIDYINAHATSTGANDRCETKAIKAAFGERAYHIPVSSTKSMIGHTIGAAGAIEAAVCALAIKDRFVPPTINYKDKDPDCDLDYVPNVGREAKLDTVVSNSFGFGNCNVCLIFSKLNR